MSGRGLVYWGIASAVGFLVWRGTMHDSLIHASQTQQKQAVADDRSEFMREKLAMTGRIVEGLATEDFDLIRQGATELNSLSEHAAWKAPNDPYYEYYSGNFSQAARQLITAAESNSVEKATYAYMHVTVSCTACHQHVRGRVRVAR